MQSSDQHARIAGITLIAATLLSVLAMAHHPTVTVPDITQAILRGRQPATLTADKLSRITRIPFDWQAQREALGFH